jgi:hypothetical protein
MILGDRIRCEGKRFKWIFTHSVAEHKRDDTMLFACGRHMRSWVKLHGFGISLPEKLNSPGVFFSFF